jgi:hypothetical protein
MEYMYMIMAFNATFNNILAISWRPVLVVEEAGVSRENHRPYAWAGVGLSNCRTIEASDYRSAPMMPTPLFYMPENFLFVK